MMWSLLHFWMHVAASARKGGVQLRPPAVSSAAGLYTLLARTVDRRSDRTAARVVVRDRQARRKLVALSALRRDRVRASGWPLSVTLGDSDRAFPPPETGGGAGSAGPGAAHASGAGAIPALFAQEARIANALWTSFPDHLDGLDVGVGRRWVWILPRALEQVWRIDRLTGKFGSNVLSPGGGATRISVSRPTPGTNEAEVAWAVDVFGFVRVHTGSWQLVGSQGALDIAAGVAGDQYPLNDGVYNVFRATTSGSLERLAVFDQVVYWLPLGLSPLPSNDPPWPAATTVALDRVPGVLEAADPLLADLWFVRTDDQIGSWKAPQSALGNLPGGAWDLGAGDDGALWAVGNTEAADAGAKGNAIWRFDPAAKQWQSISPGWGTAVDVDEEGNPWVLDSDGKLHVRGARMPGVFDNLRGKPKPGETWDELFLALATPAAYSELIVQSRVVGAGGTVLLASWDDYVDLSGADPNFQTNYKTQFAEFLGTARGIELLYCMAPIFNRRARVPFNLAGLATAVDSLGKAYVDLNVPFVRMAYRDLLVDLASVPGFAERVRYLSLGNEVDAYLLHYDDASEQWTSYFDFCAWIIGELRPKLPHTKFGVTWTFDGILANHPKWAQLLQNLDALFVNYYAVKPGPPFNPNPAEYFQVKSPAEYEADFEKLLQLADAFAPDKPIVLQEVGMPTDGVLGGSSAKQAAFIGSLLKFWDTVGVRLRFASWFLMYDLLYDPKLKVSVGSLGITVDQSEAGYPKTVPGSTAPFWGLAHNLPGLFLGPYGPGGDPVLEPTATDIAYWINQSTTPGTLAERLARFLSSCGLLAADGRIKPVDVLKIPDSQKKFHSGWHALHDGLEARRRQVT